jgi:hypothetical protein
MRQGVFLPLWRMAATLASPTFLCQGHQWIQAKSAYPAAERLPLGGAWFSRAVSDSSHSTIFSRLSIVYITVFEFLSCVFLGFFVSVTFSCSSLSQTLSVWVFEDLYTHQTTFTNGPDYWYPCHKPIGPYLWKHCFRVLSFLIFTLCCPSLVFVFSLLNVIFFMYLKK